jgi:hypothetical protein
MQGVHAFEPKAKASIDLESFVAEDHFLRRINRILDLSFIRELTAPRYAAEQGRPSIDPEVYFACNWLALTRPQITRNQGIFVSSRRKGCLHQIATSESYDGHFRMVEWPTCADHWRRNLARLVASSSNRR